MAKIIGCVVAWGAKDFIVPALNQATEYCDEVFVCVAPHSEEMRQFEDGTRREANKFVKRSDKDIKIVDWNTVNFHAPTKANILNTMLSKSKYREPDNWIWVLDVDEFYSEIAYTHVLDIINSKKYSYDLIEFQEYYFYINMNHYLRGSHLRLFKIKQGNNTFLPTQRWVYATNPIVMDCNYCPMFHYGMLTNPYAKIAFWKSEYPNSTQTHKVDWLDKIYRNYNLSNEYAWVEENRKLFNIVSPWFSESFSPQADGSLFRFNGFHPKFISKDLQREKDFRLKYNFLPNKKLEGDL